MANQNILYMFILYMIYSVSIVLLIKVSSDRQVFHSPRRSRRRRRSDEGFHLGVDCSSMEEMGMIVGDYTTQHIGYPPYWGLPKIHERGIPIDQPGFNDSME